jgi:hypothetical protein
MNGNEGYWSGGISIISQNFPKSPSILFHALNSSVSQTSPQGGENEGASGTASTFQVHQKGAFSHSRLAATTHQKSPVLPLLFNSLHPALPRPMPSRRHRHNSLKKIKSKSPERTTQLLSETKPRKFCRQERDPLPAQCRRLLPILKSCCLGARSSENQTSVTNNH